jgi:hypothetical protein
MYVWSTAYLVDGAAELDPLTVVVEERQWKRLHDRDEEVSRLIARFRSAAGDWYAALGTPVRSVEGMVDGEGERIFVPMWMLERMGLEGAGEEVDVEWLTQEYLPEATRMVLRPHDSAFYHADAKEELERALTRLGVLQSGSSIVIPLDVLGGYEITFDVVMTEPANLVLAHGEEVALEFEAALDGAAEAQAAAPAAGATAAALEPEPEPEPFDATTPMFEAAAATAAAAPPTTFQGQGQVLGGVNRRMPDGRPWNPWREKAAPKVAS